VSLIDTSFASEIAHQPGVRRADPLLVLPENVHPSKFVSAQVWGFVPGGIGEPRITQGRTVRANGEVVADDRVGPKIGAQPTISRLPFTIVGITHGLTLFGGQPNAYITLHYLQRLSF